MAPGTPTLPSFIVVLGISDREFLNIEVLAEVGASITQIVRLCHVASAQLTYPNLANLSVTVAPRRC